MSVQFRKGKSVLPARCGHDHIKQIKKGNVSCEIEFEVPPVNPLQLMIDTTHRKKLTIDALRTLKFEY